MLALCVLAFVASVAADPQRCCVDREFEATLGEFGGMVLPGKAPQPLNGYSFMSYDYYAKKMRLEAHMMTPNGTEQVTHVLMDYKAGKEYIMSSTGCTVMPIVDSMQQPCIPSTAKYEGNTTFGFLDESIRVNMWQYMKPGTDNVVTLAVTMDGCIPMVEASYGTMNGAKTNVVYFVTNFKPGIAHRSVFNTPQNCVPSTTSSSSNVVVGRAVRAMKNLF